MCEPVVDESNQIETIKLNQKQGRWTRSEHIKFLQALILYGRDWRAVQSFVKTRSSTQSRSHAQKFFSKIRRKGISLSDFLEGIDFKNLEKLSSCEIGLDDDIDLVLRTGFDDEEISVVPASQPEEVVHEEPEEEVSITESEETSF